MKHYIKILSLALLFTAFISCKKKDTPADPNIRFAATLSGASEVPANASTASGSATANYNDDTDILTVTTTYTGMTATAGHIHTGAAGTAGPVVFPFSSLTSPIALTTVALTLAQEADLKANLHYVNLHSAAFTGGEIRGQLIRQ